VSINLKLERKLAAQHAKIPSAHLIEQRKIRRRYLAEWCTKIPAAEAGNDAPLMILNREQKDRLQP
jgi:hypothetical protein